MINDSVIGFCKFFNKEVGRIHYGCKGIGSKYDEFYDWLKTKSYKTTSADWPWHYFRFDKSEDADEFEKRYSKEYFDDSTKED